VATSADGVGCAAQVFNGTGLRIFNQPDKGGWFGGAVVDTVPCFLDFNTWYTFDVVMVVNANGTQTVTAQVLQGSAQIATVTATSVFTVGDYIGINAAAGNDADAQYATLFDNIHVQASGSNGFTPVNIATSYVFTFVNDLGEESTPSAPSSTIQRPDGVSVAVTTPTTIPSGISSTYGITTKRIYRAATGNTGTVFRFVAEIPLATETYEDVLTDEQLGEVLESEEFDLPPDDLRGIIALPNGVMAGFSKNQLCLSAQNRPHAWPVGNRLITDTDIVAIANIDTTVVVGTESFVYSASGNDPAAYSMSQPGAPQACVSKRSMRYLNDQVGVVFASPDGLMAMTGPTTVRNVTEGVFTRRQWQDLVPETIQAAVHDQTYFWWYDNRALNIEESTAVWDPATDTNGTYVVSDSGTSASKVWPGGAGSPASLKSSMVRSTGKRYVEFTITSATEFPFEAQRQIGLSAASDTGLVTIGVSVSITTGQVKKNATTVDNLGAVVVGDTIMMAIDLDTHVCWVGLNGGWISGDPGQGSSPTVTGLTVTGYKASVSTDSPLSIGVRLKSVSSDFTYTVPGGFNSWGYEQTEVTGGALGAYALDTSPSGFGLIELSHHAAASYSDPLTDALFLVLDDVSDTIISGSPFDYQTPNADGRTIFEFDGDPATPLARTWRGKVNLLERPTAFAICQVKAEDYSSILLRLYADGALLTEVTVTSQEEFTLPLSNEYTKFEIEVYGTSRVYSIQVAEDVMELT